LVEYLLRKAIAEDAATIRELIRQVRINPMGLDWKHFQVAVRPSGELVGCGQIKLHNDGSRELASIAVRPEYRRKGIAQAIIQALLAEAPRPIYLTCRARLGSLYARFGFQAVTTEQMPAYFRRLSRLARAFDVLSVVQEGLLVMRLE
jgi:N-acetylglutamate synthase-like GNAT family acetyltransferase